MTDIAERVFINLIPESSGGGGGGTSDYTDLENKPKVNNVTLSGNKTPAQLGLVGDVQVNGTSVTTAGVANIPVASTSDFGTIKWGSSKGIKVDANGVIGLVAPTDGQVTAKANNDLALTLGKIDLAVRSVKPACTTITAPSTTATITANSTYAHAVGSSGCVYTISTPTDTSTVYNGFILMLDTTNSASIAFQTDATPAVTISISGNPTIELNKKYTVTGQFNPLSSAWELFIISYEV